MEREGKGEGRGGEMRKGIIVGGMALLLVLGCNNGGELVSEKRLGEIGRSAENAFYSFVDFIAGTLGFRVTKDKNKSEVANYFNSLGEKLGKTSEELEKVAEKSVADGDKDGLLNKGIREAVDTAKNTLKELKKHLEDLKDIGGEQKVGEAAGTGGAKEGTPADDGVLKKVLKAFKGIVDIADKEGVEKLKVGDTTLQLSGGADNSAGAKILSTASSHQPTTTDAGKAASILASVSGEEMLASIVASKEEHVKELGSAASVTTTPLEFAIGGGNNNYLGTNATPKAAAVAAGVALRSLVKGGVLAKGAADTATGGGKDVQGVGITAVNKLLGAVEDLIKKAVKNILGTARQKIDNARDSKVTVQK